MPVELVDCRLKKQKQKKTHPGYCASSVCDVQPIPGVAAAPFLFLKKTWESAWTYI